MRKVKAQGQRTGRKHSLDTNSDLPNLHSQLHHMTHVTLLQVYFYSTNVMSPTWWGCVGVIRGHLGRKEPAAQTPLRLPQCCYKPQRGKGHPGEATALEDALLHSHRSHWLPTSTSIWHSYQVRKIRASTYRSQGLPFINIERRGLLRAYQKSLLQIKCTNNNISITSTKGI